MDRGGTLTRCLHRWAVRARLARPARLVVSQRRSPAPAVVARDARGWQATLHFDRQRSKERMAIDAIDRYLDEHPHVGALEVVTNARELLRADADVEPVTAKPVARHCHAALRSWAGQGVLVTTRRDASQVAELRRLLDPQPPPPAADALVVASDASFDDTRRVGAWSWAADGKVATGRVPKRLGSSFDCELFALVAAVRAQPPDAPLVVLCDCASVVEGARHVAATGTAPVGLRGSGRVKHLWRELIELTAHRQVSFEWVKGHAGHPLHTVPDIASRRMVRRLAAAA